MPARRGQKRRHPLGRASTRCCSSTSMRRSGATSSAPPVEGMGRRVRPARLARCCARPGTSELRIAAGARCHRPTRGGACGVRVSRATLLRPSSLSRNIIHHTPLRPADRGGRHRRRSSTSSARKCRSRCGVHRDLTLLILRVHCRGRRRVCASRCTPVGRGYPGRPGVPRLA